MLLPPTVATGRLLIDPTESAYRIQLPPDFEQGDRGAWAEVKVCVSKTGEVSEAKVLKAAHPALGPKVVEAMARWKYEPLVVNDRPIPFCYVDRQEIVTPAAPPAEPE